MEMPEVPQVNNLRAALKVLDSWYRYGGGVEARYVGGQNVILYPKGSVADVSSLSDIGTLSEEEAIAKAQEVFNQWSNWLSRLIRAGQPENMPSEIRYHIERIARPYGPDPGEIEDAEDALNYLRRWIQQHGS